MGGRALSGIATSAGPDKIFPTVRERKRDCGVEVELIIDLRALKLSCIRRTVLVSSAYWPARAISFVVGTDSTTDPGQK